MPVRRHHDDDDALTPSEPRAMAPRSFSGVRARPESRRDGRGPRWQGFRELIGVDPIRPVIWTIKQARKK